MTHRTMRGWKQIWRGGAVLVAIAIVAGLGLAATGSGRQWLHRVDGQWFGERVMDTLARIRSTEDWRQAEPLRTGQDYAWLTAAAKPVRIAHALGESGMPTANTLAAMRRAHQAGFRLFEVDLVLEDGELRCQHDPGPQTAMVRDGCTFETLLAELPRDAYLVLDIKTDFAAVGRRIVDRVRGTPDAARIVFQLYRPEDFAVFNAWQREARLPGPILTAYLAHRRMDHVASQVPRIGVQAFTVPVERLVALSSIPIGARILVHPLHSCAAWSSTPTWIDGGYTLSTLRCEAAIRSGST